MCSTHPSLLKGAGSSTPEWDTQVDTELPSGSGGTGEKCAADMYIWLWGRRSGQGISYRSRAKLHGVCEMGLVFQWPELISISSTWTWSSPRLTYRMVAYFHLAGYKWSTAWSWQRSLVARPQTPSRARASDTARQRQVVSLSQHNSYRLLANGGAPTILRVVYTFITFILCFQPLYSSLQLSQQVPSVVVHEGLSPFTPYYYSITSKSI
jgi:hypothetical protein